ncbi:ABC transporter permease [Enterococcus sp.]|uniref:ABC transporter permease n=1 Tax=Enterococcus sp. TaxID=35783 RepID=UPI0028A6B8CD|nr:ABC transporter permease [Enterococcus sp.]
MLFKIGWRSFLRQSRNYGVYFICMMTAVMIFYSFSAMMNDRLLTQRVQQDIRIEGVLGFGSSIVAFVVLFFMLSANHFFLSQRQKEINIYQLLGLRRGRLAWLLLRETFLLNFFSLVIGIFMGIIFSKFFSMILIRAMGLTLTSHFFNSSRSIVTTIVVFFAALLILSLQVMLFVWRTPMSETLKTDYSLPIKKMKMTPFRILMGILGLILLGVGYYLSLFLKDTWQSYITYTQDFSAIIWVPLLILFCCITATYIFFDCTLPALLHWLSQPQKRNIKGAKLIAYNNVRAYLQRTWKSFAFLTVLTAIAISLIGGTMGMISLNYQATSRLYPVSYQVAESQAQQLRDTLKDNQVTLAADQTVTFKMTNMAVYTRYLGETTDNNQEEVMVNLLSLSQYNQLRKLLKESPEVKINGQEAALFDSEYDITQAFRSYRDQVLVAGTANFTLVQTELDYLGDDSLRYALANVLVVSDAAFEQLDGYQYAVTYLQVQGRLSEAAHQTISDAGKTEWVEPVTYRLVKKKNGAQAVFTTAEKEHTDQVTVYRLNRADRFTTMRSVRRQGGIILFVSLFVGVIVLITTSSSLIVRQFSNTEREKRNYQLLTKLGYSRQEIRKLIYWQNIWVFMPGTLLAILHAVFAINTLTQIIDSRGYWVAYLFAGAAAVVYLLAYLITVKLSLRIIER